MNPEIKISHSTKRTPEIDKIMLEGEYVPWQYPTNNISSISEKPKFTNGIEVCTVVVLSGVSKQTGKRVSLMIHQMPYLAGKNDTLNDNSAQKRAKYRNILISRITEFTNQIVPSSIELSIAGGTIAKGVVGRDSYRRSGLESVVRTGRLLQHIINKQLRQDKSINIFQRTAVIALPNIRERNYQTEIYYDTQSNGFYVKRDVEQEELSHLAPISFSKYISSLRSLNLDNKNYEL